VQHVMQKPDMHGSVYAVLSAASIAVGLVASKQALNTLNAETFSLLWSLLAFVMSSIFGLSRGRLTTFRGLNEHWVPTVVVGLLIAASVLAVSVAVQLADPTSVSFLTRMEAVFTAVLGMLIFKERLTRPEVLGSATALGGVLVMALAARGVSMVAFGLAVGASLFVAISTVIAKSALQHLEPTALVAGSRLVASLSILVYALLFATLQMPSIDNLVVTAVGVFWGPLLGFILLYKALSISEVFMVATLRTSYPLFVALLSLLFFRTLPSLLQMAGGALIVLGILALVRGRHSR
jgi:drug/metabolite transporter (DMT)-like permease